MKTERTISFVSRLTCQNKANINCQPNIDQAFLVVTVNYPETSTTFIDRFLAGAEAYRIPVILVFNKHDLLSEDELRYQHAVMNLYETIGYQCVEIQASADADSPFSVEALKPLLADKITLLSGE